jgi:hypothetical protein
MPYGNRPIKLRIAEGYENMFWKETNQVENGSDGVA